MTKVIKGCIVFVIIYILEVKIIILKIIIIKQKKLSTYYIVTTNM